MKSASWCEQLPDVNNVNSINADFVSQGNQEEVLITCCIPGACRWCCQNWKKEEKKLQQFLWLQTIYWCGGALFTGCTIISINSSRQLHFVFFAVNGWMSSISFWISCFTLLEIHYHISGFGICISLRDNNSLAAQLQAKNIQVAYWSSLEHLYKY